MRTGPSWFDRKFQTITFRYLYNQLILLISSHATFSSGKEFRIGAASKASEEMAEGRLSSALTSLHYRFEKYIFAQAEINLDIGISRSLHGGGSPLPGGDEGRVVSPHAWIWKRGRKKREGGGTDTPTSALSTMSTFSCRDLARLETSSFIATARSSHQSQFCTFHSGGVRGGASFQKYPILCGYLPIPFFLIMVHILHFSIPELFSCSP
ncbi:hypothetical protein AVEN_275042-1 [Araneus ventricosus]|uniref:Uncharacterized protein n=1 Tax=Araneus ventricosus TaxID=182803 RepID=A0A4Y2EW80_ARAVE|nr:hypothetical protein AVEN_275042-1 [Araneus ventricosus]